MNTLLVESHRRGRVGHRFLEIAIITCSRLSLDSGIPCLHLHYLFDLMIEDINIDVLIYIEVTLIVILLGCWEDRDSDSDPWISNFDPPRIKDTQRWCRSPNATCPKAPSYGIGLTV